MFDHVSIWFSRHGMFVGDRGSDMMSRMVDYSSRDSPYKSGEQQGDEYSADIENTLRILW